MQFQKESSYSVELLLKLFSLPIYAVLTFSIWNALFEGSTTKIVEGVNLSQMITYSIIGMLLGSFLNSEIAFLLEEKIKSGDIVGDLIRPIHSPIYYLIGEISKSTVGLVIRSVFLILVAIVISRYLIFPQSVLQYAAFLLSVIFALFITFFLYFSIGALAFWLTEIESLDHFQLFLQSVLSGVLIPSWFFPEQLEKINFWLPFRFMFEFPMSIFIGRLNPSEYSLQFAIALTWSIVLFAIANYIWKRGLKMTMVSGG